MEQKLKLIPFLLTSCLVLYSFIKFNISNIESALVFNIILVIAYLIFVNSKSINVYRVIRYFIMGILISATIGYVLAFIPEMKHISVYVPETRFKSLVGHPNSFQIMCLVGLSLLVWMFFRTRIKYIPFLIYYTIISIVGLTSQSKSFLIISLVLLLVFLVILFIKNKKLGVVTFFGVVFLGTIVFTIFNEEILSIIDRFTKYEYSNVVDSLLTGRLSIWLDYINKWKSSVFNIIFGCGITSAGEDGHGGHNLLIMLIYKLGLAGFTLLIALCASYFMLVKNKLKKFKFVNLIPLTTLLLISLSEDLWGSTLLFVVLISMTLFKSERIILEGEYKKSNEPVIENKKISVIIPVYNVENYLRRGLDSVINQTYSNLEIIIIDDGSKDNSSKICDEYSLKDKRIKVVHKQNEGVSKARNAGLQIATGDFVTFMDPDDVIHERMYELLYKEITEKKTDLVMCGFKHIFEKDNVEKRVVENNLTKLEKESIYPYLLKIGTTEKDGNIHTENVMGCVWRVLFSRDIIADVTFPDLKLSEDLVFMMDVFNKNPKVAVVNEPLYGYFQRATSAMHNFNEDKIKEKMKSFEMVLLKSKNKVSEDQHNAYKYHVYASLINELIRNQKPDLVEKIINTEFMNSLYSENNYKLALKNAIGFNHKIAYFMIKHQKYKLYSVLLKII